MPWKYKCNIIRDDTKVHRFTVENSINSLLEYIDITENGIPHDKIRIVISPSISDLVNKDIKIFNFLHLMNRLNEFNCLGDNFGSIHYDGNLELVRDRLGEMIASINEIEPFKNNLERICNILGINVQSINDSFQQSNVNTTDQIKRAYDSHNLIQKEHVSKKAKRDASVDNGLNEQNEAYDNVEHFLLQEEQFSICVEEDKNDINNNNNNYNTITNRIISIGDVDYVFNNKEEFQNFIKNNFKIVIRSPEILISTRKQLNDDWSDVLIQPLIKDPIEYRRLITSQGGLAINSIPVLNAIAECFPQQGDGLIIPLLTSKAKFKLAIRYADHLIHLMKCFPQQADNLAKMLLDNPPLFEHLRFHKESLEEIADVLQKYNYLFRKETVQDVLSDYAKLIYTEKKEIDKHIKELYFAKYNFAPNSFNFFMRVPDEILVEIGSHTRELYPESEAHRFSRARFESQKSYWDGKKR